jgi:GDP-4-dehydro-6-deoxy-D-mannose reductase
VKVLVTGVSGFVGRHLVEFLRREHPQVEIFGLARHPVPGVTFIEADLEHPASVDAVFDALQPDRIVHLAAQSSPQTSWTDPERTFSTNVLGLLNLLEAVRRRGLDPLVLVVGSGEEYGLVATHELPLREDAPLRPLSPYAVSKLSQSFLALQYTLSRRVRTIRTRTFNHTGPGRGMAFAESSFARQLCEIEAGRQEPVMAVGNLDAVRDFCDVRDVVAAYWLLLEHGQAGEVYNVCSGQGVRMREVVERLIALSGQRVELRVDPQRLRPSDIPALVGDPGRIESVTGWRRTHAFDTTLRDVLEYWRALGAGAVATA